MLFPLWPSLALVAELTVPRPHCFTSSVVQSECVTPSTRPLASPRAIPLTLSPIVLLSASLSFEAKFVCGEIFSYADLVEYATESAVKAAGKQRQQGKTYEMIDGDICVSLHTHHLPSTPVLPGQEDGRLVDSVSSRVTDPVCVFSGRLSARTVLTVRI